MVKVCAVLTCSGSTTGASAVTSIVSVAGVTRVTWTSVVRSRRTCTPSRSIGMKPSRFAWSLYSPGVSAGKLNEPSASVTVTLGPPICTGEVTVMVTPGSADPELSTTVPLIWPVVWATSAETVSAKSNALNNETRFIRAAPFPEM